MKRSLGITLIATLLLMAGLTAGASAATAPKPGSKCASVGKSVVVKSLKYTCVKRGSKKVWSKGVAVKPAVTPTATPSPTPTSTGPDPELQNGLYLSTRNPKLYLTPAEPSAQAAGNETVRVIANDPSIPEMRLKYVAKTVTVGASSWLQDQYEEDGGTYLANLAMAVWGAGKDNPGHLGWANLYAKSSFENANLPFPSPGRFKYYDLRIYPDSMVLYNISKPIELPYELDKAIAYMDQFVVDEVALPKFELKVYEDWEKRSKTIGAALDTLLLKAAAHAKARNIGLEYIGHAGGTGGLLEGIVFTEHAIPVLQHLVAANGGKKLAYFDTATNCDEASTLTLDDVAPFVEASIVSEFERGGFAPVCTTSMDPCWSALTNTAALSHAIRPYFFSSNLKITESLYLEALYFRHSWYSDRANVIPQSLTVVDSAKYLVNIAEIKRLVRENKTLFATKGNDDLKITFPLFGANSLVAGHRDLGKLLDKISPTARQLLNGFVVGVVNTEAFDSTPWDASGFYLQWYLLERGFWIP